MTYENLLRQNFYKLHVEQVFNSNMDKDLVVLLAARAARLDNQDAIDAAIVNLLADPKEVQFKDTRVILILKFSQHSFIWNSTLIKQKQFLLFLPGTCKHY